MNTKLHAKLIGAVIFSTAPIAHAVDVGPFTITGFFKQEFGRTSNICEDCQAIPGEDRHRPWADDIAPGKTYGTSGGNSQLFQPYIATKEFRLGEGWRVKGLWSQRWRDREIDISGVTYETNATLLHEDYGSLQVGKFPARAWSVADYPYGTQIGVADAWGASGSGYGLLQRAVRYGMPMMDVAGGDFNLEATLDFGDAAFKKYKPLLIEVYGQYVKGPWVLDGIFQTAKNGRPSAWTHGPFIGIADDASVEDLINDENRQSILMLMARYEYNAKTVLFGGARFNRWSGARASWIGQDDDGNDLWAPFFNVDGVAGGDLAYSASSTDFSLGATYRIDSKWSLSTGMVYLGQAKTANPLERGQSNSMLLNAVGVGYDVTPGFNIYAYTGMVNYGKKGLAPLSMPGHSSFSGVDSRVAKSGNWFGIGAVYTW